MARKGLYRNMGTKRAGKVDVGIIQSAEANDASQPDIQLIEETESTQSQSGPSQQPNTFLRRTSEVSEDDSLVDPPEHNTPLRPPHSYARSMRTLPSSSLSSLGHHSCSRNGLSSFSQPVQLPKRINAFQTQSAQRRRQQRTHRNSDLLSRRNSTSSGPPSSVSYLYGRSAQSMLSINKSMLITMTLGRNVVGCLSLDSPPMMSCLRL